MDMRIELYKMNGIWVTRHDDPEIVELFGTNVLPTPFFDSMEGSEVLREITELNPDKTVVLVS